MADIILIELITLLSLIFSLLLLFVAYASVAQIFLVFIWSVAAAWLFAIASRKSRLWEPSVLLMLAPLVLYNDRIAIYCIITTTIVTYLYVKTSLLKGGPVQYANNLKRAVPIFLVAAYLRSPPIINFSGSMVHASPFLIIYFLASVVLIRSIRHLDSGMEPNTIKKANTRYLLTMFFLSSLAAFEGVRNYILSLVSKLPYLIIYPVYLLYNMFIKIGEFLSQYQGDRESAPWNQGEGGPESGIGEQLEEIAEEQYAYLDMSIFDTIFTILLLAAVIYILYRLLNKAGNRSYSGRDYTEKREYIREPRHKKKRPPREKLPAEVGDQVRFYYRRFLEKLTKKVEIRKSDTSLEVNEKAETVFASGTGRIRDIYIESRYGEKPADRDKVAEMEKLYKEL